MGETSRILGLDVGEARIGVAVSGPFGSMALPHSTVERTTLEQDFEAMRAIVAETKAVCIVAGLPLDREGNPGPQAEKVLAFLDALRPAVGVEVVTQDERYSTAAAERAIAGSRVRKKRRKQVVDRIAAQHILQVYLDRQANQRAFEGQ